MSPVPVKPSCPHCGAPLQPFRLPEGSGYDEPFHLACFNDGCDYFRRGWSWMLDHYGVKASYRYRVNPATGTASPLPVWSKGAIKDHILDAEISVEDVGAPTPPPAEARPRKPKPPKKGKRP